MKSLFFTNYTLFNSKCDIHGYLIFFIFQSKNEEACYTGTLYMSKYGNSPTLKVYSVMMQVTVIC
jgi:hypothetical protein